ncbi:MAG: hypothetical protein Q7J10_03805 [Methanosarcinaceae archaeon]|nr:hypothetical protein [Methanosarcinaceae archaeon]
MITKGSEHNKDCFGANNKNILLDQTAFSSTIDAMFFLMMISIAAVLLMPSIMADNQYDAAGYTAIQEFDTHLLESLLSSSLDEFEYEIAPLSVVNISIPSNSITQGPMKTLFGREQNHRTFSDVVAESMALNLMMDNNGSRVYLNPIAKEHSIATTAMMQSYLDAKIGGRYNYRFEAHWYPVSGFSLGSDILVGDTPPTDAIRQSAKLTLPFTYVSSKNDIFEMVNDSVLADAFGNSSNETMRAILYDGFNDSINVAARGAAKMIVDSMFPSEYLRSLNNTGTGTQSDQLGIISTPDNADILDPDFLIAIYLLDHTANTVAGLDIEIPVDIILSGMVTMVEQEFTDAIQEKIAFQLKTDMADEINSTVNGIIDSTDFGNAQNLRDVQIESIYRIVNRGGVDIELMLWQ